MSETSRPGAGPQAAGEAGPVAERYEALVARGAIERDPAQVKLVRALDRLLRDLAQRRRASKSSALGWLFGQRSQGPEAPRGLYIWGSVGRGKTMLMDLFHEAAPEPKRRVHFHGFLADVHERVHAHRQALKAGTAKGDDPIPPVADALAAEARLLCFDEFTVTDIADAMILGRLFGALFSRGVTVVATSNVEPDRLYEGGLNRALFLPFVAELQERVEVLRLDSRTDFRLEKLGGASVWHVPADAAAKAALDTAFRSLTGKARGKPATIRVKGRDVAVPEEAAGVARVPFADLCAKPLGASDYLALVSSIHTLILEDIPVMGEENRNEAKRFITLVDTLYEARVKLLASAAADAPDLYKARDGREAFEFDRTVSRLIEMRSGEYLALPKGHGDSGATGSSAGLAET
ncbi:MULTISPECIES: cell division protein ZapE [Methylobacterium]|uniref:Cell division protein ZapE n=4 Tax=Pseudomonadota TaxID=1224 RepID=A0ABQ4T0A3_9HYPH|nr:MULTISPECIES: cell division protein ZapE [Methylobacterium]PIU07177.1 MAG: cell division protein ZapE [Methylobacterium sp. CG09_land_8_20_14_0_10_71_15]PIU12669.1 MAG: cell division protein ZapE [Methylobacterium sp. CG08_land_8_20_14_0_20_71_15]GBU19840.1 cell division protein ZapE [Methylobacterium sp.]GJE08527.1 Cell division protein ZapE [Methylobacterium jeotgali]